jgi:hypothetical protein
MSPMRNRARLGVSCAALLAAFCVAQGASAQAALTGPRSLVHLL